MRIDIILNRHFFALEFPVELKAINGGVEGGEKPIDVFCKECSVGFGRNDDADRMMISRCFFHGCHL